MCVPKSKNSHVQGGGRAGGTNFQLLILSSYLLKSKIPMSSWGGGVGGTNFQLLMLSSNLLKSKIPMSGGGGGGRQVGGTNFQILMLSSNLLKKLKFLGKKHNGFVFNFEYQVAHLYEV